MGEQKVFIGIIAVTIVLFVGLLFFMDNSQTVPVVDSESLIGTETHEKGASEEDAILTIVEFSDFQCPACRAAHPLLASFVEEHKDEVRLIYRHFPLTTIHLNARLAAVASEIAADEGLFWEYHDKLFDNQEEWGPETVPNDLFVQYAEELEMDAEAFRENLTSQTYVDNVAEDQAKAGDLNLNSTPSVYFNGVLHKGVPLEADMQGYLDEAREVASAGE